MSRGYGSRRGEKSDEARELARQLPGVMHIEDPDRVRAAWQAIWRYRSQLLVLDDGFQHRRLARDLDIVLIDALEPFGYRHVFPRGMLREPCDALGRADAVVLSRADLVGADRRRWIRRQIRRFSPSATWCEVVHRPRHLESADGRREPLEALADQRVAAFCGIGNPAGFRRTLASRGIRTAGFRRFADHHPYQAEDLQHLAQWAATLRAEAVICTWKDLVKIGTPRLGGCPLWALAIEVEITEGHQRLLAALDKLSASKLAA